jgi:hypothetical protein
MIALPDRSYIIQQGDNVEIFGEAYVLKSEEITQICENNKSINFVKDNTMTY